MYILLAIEIFMNRGWNSIFYGNNQITNDFHRNTRRNQPEILDISYEKYIFDQNVNRLKEELKDLSLLRRPFCTNE